MDVLKRLKASMWITIALTVALSLLYMATGVGMVDLIAHPELILLIFLLAYVLAPRVAAWRSARKSESK